MMSKDIHEEAAPFQHSDKNKSVKSSCSIADFTLLSNFRDTKIEDSMNLSNHFLIEGTSRSKQPLFHVTSDHIYLFVFCYATY
jgi:hypothetical protein